VPHLLRRFLAVIFALHCVVVSAQPGELRFGHLDQPDAPGTVSQIGEDSLGFLWMASINGLVRYDGYSYTWYKNKLSDTSSLSHNIISSLVCLPDHNLWVGTKNGLNYFDRATEKFVRFVHDPANPNSISDNHVLCVHADKEGMIWAGTKSGGLNKYDPLTKKFTRYQSNPHDPGALSNDEVKDIVEDAAGNLWIGTDGGGVELLDKKTGTFRHFRFNENDPGSISGDYINDMEIDGRGNLLIAVSGAGLNIMNVRTHTVQRFYSDASNRNSLASNETYSLGHDSRGLIWIGLWSKGLNSYNPATGEFRHYRNHPDLATTISDDVVHCMFEDSRNIFYVATGFVDWLDPFYLRFSHYVHNPANEHSVVRNDITSIYEESEERLWIGTYNGGLSVYNRPTNTFRHYVHDPENPAGLPNNGIWDIMRDSKDRFWVCTSRGLCLLDTVTGNCKVFHHDEDDSTSLSANNIIIAAEDPKGMFWLGTWYGGVNYFNPETGKAIRYAHDDNDSTSLSSNNIKAILVDSKARVWIGTSYGLNLFNSKDGTFTRFFNNAEDSLSLSENNVNALYQDSRGNIWVATAGGGFDLMNPEAGTFRRYTEEDGLSSNLVVGIVEDNEGKLWIGTSTGLDKFYPDITEFRNYDEYNGAESGYNNWAFAKGKTSRLFFGSSAGLTEFEPQAIVPNTQPPALTFTDFYLFNKRVEVNDSTPLKQAVELTNSITLTYEDYVFAFQFAALNFRQANRCRYAYRLEGFNDDWIYTDANNRMATFTNVPHGEYTLRVIGSNEDGHWNKEGISMQIIILPPWWLTWWAKTLWVVLIAGSAITFYLVRVTTLERQKRNLEEKVVLRTAQVVQQKEEITREKEKSDKLLLNILPRQTAEELKESGHSMPRYYKQVTILFSDFKGFTKISSEMAPGDLVRELEDYFTAFDEIIEKHNVEKIKTIGDAYMCAGGIPVPNETNAVDTVEVAIEMVAWVNRWNEQRMAAGKKPWPIRIGIHTGPLVAGVIGRKKFAYDVWGDSVNVASRLESNSEAGRINISAETYELVKHRFECTYRGEIEIKNRGAIPMYYVSPQ
jgi:ligand-binding sensor domain-containing protein/class 3 adenylate cyclase